ncbi:MAG: hypothetical protein PUB53_02095 [Bacteroidales bacterium]|nr:hypothetical protein [Bacteroidales bacterium]
MKYAFIWLASLLTLCISYNAQAQSQKGQTIYAFAYGTCFSDSTVYVSPVSTLPGAQLEKKTRFLERRAEWAATFKTYLDNRFGRPHTCVVFFDTKKEKLEKKLVALRKQVAKQKDQHFTELTASDFMLPPALDDE